MGAFRFEWGWMLWGIIPVCLSWPFLVWLDLNRARARLEMLGQAEEKTLKLRAIKLSMAFSSFALMILALARPQTGIKGEIAKDRGIEIVLAVDVSASMGVEDIYPNRLGRVKAEIMRLLRRREGGLIGVVAFAGRAAVICPLTDDFEAVKEVVKSLKPECIPSPGTKISEALNEAIKCFTDEKKPKMILLLTDGETHGDEDEAVKLARRAKKKGIKLFAIGVGTVQGGTVPGREAISKLKTELLSKITAETGGYWGVSLEGIWPKLIFERKAMSRTKYLEYKELYRYPVLGAIMFLIIGTLL